MNISPEGHTLLAMLRASLSEAAAGPEPIPPSLDWSALQRLVRHHRLGPLLSHTVRRHRWGGIPDWLRLEWDAQRLSVVATDLHHRQALEEIAGAFSDRQVSFMLLKGEALSKGFYPEEGLRPSDDIDFLIRPDVYHEARAILIKLGFRPRKPAVEVEKRVLFGEVEFDREGLRTLTVDLHWDTLMASWESRSLFREEEAWGSRDQIRLGHHVIPVLGGEVLLLYLCVHFAFHHVFDGLILLCDLFLVLRRDQERICWDRLLAMATRYRCRHAVYYSLSFAKALLGAQVQPDILAALQPAPSNRFLMPAGRLLFCEALVPQMLERYVKFLLIDTRAGRFRAVRAWLQSSKPLLVSRRLP